MKGPDVCIRGLKMYPLYMKDALGKKYLLHPRTDLPIPPALFAPVNVKGRNNGRSPQRGEWTESSHVSIISQSAHNIT